MAAIVGEEKRSGDPSVSSAHPPERVRSPSRTAKKGFWASKSKLQFGCITLFVVMLLGTIGSLPGVLQSKTGENLRNLIVNPHTHQLAATSGAMFCLIATISALGIWALFDTKENRIVPLFKALFEEKDTYQTGILVSAAAIVFVALPFILLTAQGCEPFKEGWDKFQNFINSPTPSFQDAFPATVVTFCIGTLALQVISSLLKNKESFPWWDKKSEAQQKALYTLAAVVIVGSIFLFLTAKGVQPFDKGWENFKALITDHTTDVAHALPAVGIIMGILGASITLLWNLVATKKTRENLEMHWYGKENVWRRRLLKGYTFLFLVGIPLLILSIKGVSPLSDGAKFILQSFSDNPTVSISTFFALLIMGIGLAYALLPEAKSLIQISQIKADQAREARRKKEALQEAAEQAAEARQQHEEEQARKQWQARSSAAYLEYLGNEGIDTAAAEGVIAGYQLDV